MSTSSSSGLAASVATGSTTVAITLNGVSAGDVIVLEVLDRSNETSVISSISDTVNGSWPLNYVNGGPQDSTASTYRNWMPYLLNSGAGNPVITVTFDGAINSQLAAAWLHSTLGAMTFQGAATVRNAAVNETAVASNTIAVTGPGCIVGAMGINNAQADPEPTADGAGESRCTAGQAGGRAFLFFEAVASASTVGFETTLDSGASIFQVGAFLEPSAGSLKTETIDVSDGIVRYLRRVRDGSDVFSVSDGDTYRQHLMTISESTEFADGFVQWRRLKRLLSDNIDLIDGFSKTLSGAGIVYARVLSETITLIDDAGQRWRLRTSQLTDTVGLSDAVVRYLRRIRQLGEDVEFSDGVVTIGRKVRVCQDDLEIPDDVVRLLVPYELFNVNIKFSHREMIRFGGN